MATLSKPVVFQNMVDPSDSVNVSIVFLMALDKPHAQIAMLQEIAGVIQDGELLKRLVKAQEARDVIREFTTIGK
jgi:PTS system galactitol-specific IIA component